MTRNAGAVFALCILSALAGFLFFGIHHERSWQDAQQYDALAAHLVQGEGYTLDGMHFSILREPGYPFLLTILYSLFGIHNLLAVSLLQVLLIGICGFLIYRLFAWAGNPAIGCITGILVCLIPYYGYYENEILTETLTTLIVVLGIYVTTQIAAAPKSVGWKYWVALGIIAGCGTLVRAQFLFLLPFLLLSYAVFIHLWAHKIVKGIGIAFLICYCMIGAWMLYVHAHLGTFAITQGRQEMSLYIRADRSLLSYSQLNEYARDWIKRSLSGGQETDFLAKHDYGLLDVQYVTFATTSEVVSMMRHQDIETILTHPGHYLYDSGIEVMKLLYIEHDFQDSLNKYIRGLIYIALYSGAVLGAAVLIFVPNNTRSVRIVASVSFLFIVYNSAITSLFDAIPRYNTPYLFCYLVIALAGLAHWRTKSVPQLSL